MNVDTTTTYKDPLLQQLQKRIPLLAQSPSKECTQALQALITLLYDAQYHGQGVLHTDSIIHDYAESISIEQLPSIVPELFAPDQGVFVHFGNYITFRRPYLQMLAIASHLQQHSGFTQLSPTATHRISWSLGNNRELNDGQKCAALSAASSPICIITGGAGTGKTTTLSKALELILLDNPEKRIVLSAPTGKAAQRLNESLQNNHSHCHPAVLPQIQELNAITLHRLLAVSETTGRAYKHNRNPINCDVIVVDEASMIGGAMMEQLLNALLPHTQLILMGDPHQLPPVNASDVFSDLTMVNGAQPSSYPVNRAFADYLESATGIVIPSPMIREHGILLNQRCHLTESKRFQSQSVIERSATAVLAGDAGAFAHALTHHTTVVHQTTQLCQELAHSYPTQPAALLEAFAQRIILCAGRKGGYGSNTINQHLDSYFKGILGTSPHTEWYEGRQIMVEKNYYDLNIFNGDIGTCRYRNGTYEIHFSTDVVVPVDLLPVEYSLAFAITIHKSQGSEYQHTDIVLPIAGSEQQYAHRNALIYTALTRAKNSISIFTDNPHIQLLIESTAPAPQQGPLSYLLATKQST